MPYTPYKKEEGKEEEDSTLLLYKRGDFAPNYDINSDGLLCIRSPTTTTTAEENKDARIMSRSRLFFVLSFVLSTDEMTSDKSWGPRRPSSATAQ